MSLSWTKFNDSRHPNIFKIQERLSQRLALDGARDEMEQKEYYKSTYWKEVTN